MAIPRASITSAEPHLEVKDRLPCLATVAPAPAATKAAAVEILNVVTAPPPVPQVSTRFGASVSTFTIAPRSARAAPATSSAVSPLTRSPTRSAAVWAAVHSPRITAPNTSAAKRSLRDWRSASAVIACCRGREAAASDMAASGSRNLPRKIAFCQTPQRVARLDWPSPRPYFTSCDEPALPRGSALRRGPVPGMAAAAARAHRPGRSRSGARADGGPEDDSHSRGTDRHRRTRARSGWRVYAAGGLGGGRGGGGAAAEPDYRCRVALAEWAPRTDGTGVTFTIEADRFLHRMVRFLVGAMVDVGLGRRPLSDFPRLLAASNNQAASAPAPPQGLYLVAVRYPSDLYAGGGADP